MPVKKGKKPPVKKPAKASAGPVAKRTNRKSAPPVRTPPTAPVAAPVAATPPADAKAQYKAFERAMQLFNKKNFREAKEMFGKARTGPSREVAANAELHVRMCERRLAAPEPPPKSAEDRYNYAVALINMRNLPEARQHLEAALAIDPQGDHLHYAMGVCLGLSGDLRGAYDSLKRAIDIQPRNRMAARQDSDLDVLSRDARLNRLLYPEKYA